MRRCLAGLGSIVTLACGPAVGDDEGGGDGGGSSSTGGSATTMSAASSDPSAVTEVDSSGVDPGTAASTIDPSGESSDSGAVEECVDGTFVGHFVGGQESSAFVSCETGESWWFEGKYYAMPCPNGAWIRVEGQLCGPGGYGHLAQYEYEIHGAVIEGPCAAECGESPGPAQCGSIDEICIQQECDVIAQDCPEGERCVPRSFEGLPPWVGSACVPEAAMPQPLGAPCTRVGLWDDDCAAGSYCAGDRDGNRVCAAVCDPNAPACAGDDACVECETDAKLLPIGVCFFEPIEC